jgi:predicted enzyme related to lactoylglutathione lyase
MAERPRLALVILAVPELDPARDFYSRAFGWPITVEAPVYAELALPRGLRLGLYAREGFGKNVGAVPHAVPVGALAPTELYLYVADPAAALHRAVEAGGRLLSPLAPRDWGDEVGYVADPFGNVLALARDTEEA